MKSHTLDKPLARMQGLRERVLEAPLTGKAYQTVEKGCLFSSFASLLYAYAWLFRYTAFRHAEFKGRLQEKNFTLLMKDKDDTFKRWCTFQNGRVSTSAFHGPEPTFSLIWRTIPDGCRIMAQMAMGKPKVLKKAIIEGNLLLAGDAAMVGWFLETNNMMARLNK